MSNRKKIAIIGAGFAGLSASSILSKNGHEVHVFEKNDKAGGRCNVFEKEGFVFDMGPSWYWMPDVFEKYFNRLGKSAKEYYTLHRLDPSYKIYYTNEEWNIPAKKEKLRNFLEEKEKGAAVNFDSFMKEAGEKYDLAMNDFVYLPSLSWTEYLNLKIIKGAFQFSLFQPFTKWIRRYFKNPYILQWLEFPVLFLGAKPEKTPSLYSIMNYADSILGTWYPEGGMYKVAEGLEKAAIEVGVQFHYQSAVEKIVVENNRTKGIMLNGQLWEFDLVISAADYEFTDRVLLEGDANYSKSFWEKEQMSPSCLLFYWGVGKKVPNLEHHTLFFDADFAEHAKSIYDTLDAPKNPLFYLCAPSKTDPTVAPESKENIFVLIPISAGLELSEEKIEEYKSEIIERIKAKTGCDISESIEVETRFTTKDFLTLYHAYKGNAYGLASTLMQTGVLRPKIKHRKIKNMYYCGQLSVPGPGMPPALISGTIVADYIIKKGK